MIKRYKWVGMLVICLLINSIVLAASHHPQQFLDSIRGVDNEGEQIVQHFCANCHAVKPLIDLGAPKIKQESDWQVRVKQGLDVLLQHTQDGYGAMPARGGCFECSDYQLQLAIIAMLPELYAKIINKTDR